MCRGKAEQSDGGHGKASSGQGELWGSGHGDVSIAAQPATLPEMVYRPQRGWSSLIWNTPTLQRVFGVKRNFGFNLFWKSYTSVL